MGPIPAMSVLGLALGLACLPVATAGAEGLSTRPGPPPVAEPPGLWHGQLHGRTPSTVAGATVIDAPTVAALVKDRAVMIDVANVDRKPSSQPGDLPWTPIHRSIPGATWMPGAGSGTDDPAFAKAFAARIDALTGGDKDRPIVAFCHPQRWGSWNAAKRIADMGYRHVYWFPGGAESWQAYARAADAEVDGPWKASLAAVEAKGDLPP